MRGILPISSPSTHSIRRWLHRAGFILGIVSIAFVAFKLHAYAGSISFSTISSAGYVALTALAIVYAGSNLFLAVGWARVLDFLGAAPGFRTAFVVYAISQIAKYVPGNVIHLLGRQALGFAAGIGNGPLARSTVWELGLLAVSSCLFAPLAIPLIYPTYQAVSLVLFIVALLGVLWVVSKLGAGLLPALGAYVAFITVSGATFIAVFGLSGGKLEFLPSLLGAYTLAWFLGFVTPGAPAGMGIREAVLLFLLGSFNSEPTILLAVILGRIVTVAGDLIFYGFGVGVSAIWRDH